MVRSFLVDNDAGLEVRREVFGLDCIGLDCMGASFSDEEGDGVRCGRESVSFSVGQRGPLIDQSCAASTSGGVCDLTTAAGTMVEGTEGCGLLRSILLVSDRTDDDVNATRSRLSAGSLTDSVSRSPSWMPVASLLTVGLLYKGEGVCGSPLSADDCELDSCPLRSATEIDLRSSIGPLSSGLRSV